MSSTTAESSARSTDTPPPGPDRPQRTGRFTSAARVERARRERILELVTRQLGQRPPLR